MKNKYLIFAITAVLSGIIYYYVFYQRPSFSPEEYLQFYGRNIKEYSFAYTYPDCTVELEYQPGELRQAKAIVSGQSMKQDPGNMVYFIIQYKSLSGKQDSITMDGYYGLEKGLLLKHLDSLYSPVVFIPENSGFDNGKQRFFCGYELAENMRTYGKYELTMDLACIPENENLTFEIPRKLIPELIIK